MAISVMPFYAAILAVLFVYLSARVIRIRRREQVAIGDGGNAALMRAIAVHANFAEYVPLALLLGAFVELRGLPPVLVHAIGLALVAGRFVHAYGVSQQDEDYRLRVLGMTLTFAAILLAAALLIGSSVAGGEW